ncbi:fimbrial protein [Enterobacter ludwigii]|jgi:type 1 fimbria pilin|nr:type 1 fimbrial protein [Enterobacter asburiae]
MRFYFSVIVFSCIFVSVVTPSRAGGFYSGWGVINMQGAIIDTACAIAVESRDQSINMGVAPLSEIVRDGHGKLKPFSIELINCIMKRQDETKNDWRQFQVTFDGDADGKLFGVRGEASGVALQITDKHGNIAVPGQPLPHEDIAPGNMKLDYQLRLVANQHALKAGDFFSVVRFKLDYF